MLGFSSPPAAASENEGYVDNTPEAIAVWAADLHRRFGGQPVAVALEQKRGSVVNLLLPYAHLVLFPVPASMSASYRKTFVPSGAKDDPSDAGWILDLLLRHRDRLRRLEPDDANTRLLLMLVEDRRQLVDDKTRLALRLQDCLKQYFPQLVHWFDVDTPLVADLLQRWPDLQHLQRCHDGTLRTFFRQHHYGEEPHRRAHRRHPRRRSGDQRSGRAGGLFDEGPPSHRVHRHPARSDHAAGTPPRRTGRQSSRQPHLRFLSREPAVATVPRLIAAFGTRRERYQSAFEVECDSGIAPVHIRSGKIDRVSIRRACQELHAPDLPRVCRPDDPPV